MGHFAGLCFVYGVSNAAFGEGLGLVGLLERAYIRVLVLFDVYQPCIIDMYLLYMLFWGLSEIWNHWMRGGSLMS